MIFPSEIFMSVRLYNIFSQSRYSKKSHRKKMPYERYTKRLWDVISMEKAVAEYKSTDKTIDEAAAQFKVPRSSLHTR